MIFRTILSVLFAIVCLSFCSAQDLHFSNYNHAPHYLSPSKTGNYHGTYKIGAVYRDQGRAFISNPFQTQLLYIDANIKLGFAPLHWLSVGTILSNDITGALGFTKSAGVLNLGYHIPLDKKYSKIIHFGVQYGIVQSKITGDEILFGDDGANLSSPDRTLIDNFSEAYKEINFGASFQNRYSKRGSFEIGAGIYHLPKPSFLFKNGNFTNVISPRFNIYSTFRIQSTKKFFILPGLIFSKMSKATNIMAQFNTEILLDKYNDKNLQMGLGYRLGDAIQILMGMKYNDWNFSLAYDMTVSSAASYNNTFGGIEFGVSRLIRIYKKPEIPLKMICPKEL